MRRLQDATASKLQIGTLLLLQNAVLGPSDDFNRADNASMGAPWTARNAGTVTNMRITSNQATYGASTQDSTMLYSGYTHGAQGRVQAKVRCDDGFAGIQCLITLPFRNEVEFVINPSGQFAIVEHNNGTEVVLASTAGGVAGDVEYTLRLEWEIVGGTTFLRGYVDNVETLTTSTTNHVTPGGVGISSYRQSGVLYFDDFMSDSNITIDTAPGAPTGLSATAGDTQVSLSWTAPASNGGDPITDYIVQWRTTAGPGSWNTFSDGTSTSTNATVTGLTNGTSYDFQVAAVNGIGTGPYSATDTETPSSGGAPLTVDYYTTSTTSASSITPQTVAISWAVGDIVIVGVGGDNNQQDWNTPTVSGLTFSLIGSAGPVGNGSDTGPAIKVWESAKAAAGGSGSVSVSRAAGSQGYRIDVWVIHNDPTDVGSTVINLTESAPSLAVGAGSVVCYLFNDWNADSANQTLTTGSGTATERAEANTGGFSFLAGDWVGTSAGTFSFGVTSYAGLNVAQFAVEVTA